MKRPLGRRRYDLLGHERGDKVVRVVDGGACRFGNLSDADDDEDSGTGEERGERQPW